MEKFIILLFLLASCTVVREVEVPIEVPIEKEALSDWDALQLAIAMTESRMNPMAVGKTNDKGIYQITPIYAKEATRLSDSIYVHDDAFSIRKSLEMFDIVQGHYNPSHEERKAIKLHNPGASEAYYRKVMENLELVRRYEAIRQELTNF